MSDFTTIRLQCNTNTDASPTWTSIAFGGGSGANEIRWCAPGAGTSTTASAAWPVVMRTTTPQPLTECWAFSANTTGTKVLYNGTNSYANQFRVDFDNTGTMASAPILSAYSDATYAAASPGTQPGAQVGSPIINGSTDTGNYSYLKANMYGTAQTANLTAGSSGLYLSATSGAAGSTGPTAGNWIVNWQALQATTSYITFPSIPTATTASDIYFALVLYIGPNMSTGTLLPVVTFSYIYS